MLRLRPYKPCDAQRITDWITDEYGFRQWCADCYERYPISPEDMNRRYDSERDSDGSWAMTAFDEGGPAGHLIMRYPDERRDTLRFGFVIVDDKRRGMGLGREMLALAIKFAFEMVGVERITLGVFANNTRARRCYEACGFRAVERPEREYYICLGERWDCVEMELRREEYRPEKYAEGEKL